jgi:hypothetical protein
MLSSANVVQWVGQLEGARPLWRAEDVAPLVADVADDDIAGILQLLALAGLVGDGSYLDAEGLEQQLHPAGVALVVEVLHGDGPLVFGTARQEHWLDAERDELVEQPLRLRQRRHAPLQHVLVEARRVVLLSAMKELKKNKTYTSN